MSLKDFFNKTVDSTGKFLKEKNEQMTHNAKLREFKRQILNQLSTPELKFLCSHYAIEPRPLMDANAMNYAFFEETPKKTTKFVPTRDDYLNTLMNKLKTSDIIDWCRNQRIRRVESIIIGRTAYMKQHRLDENGEKRMEEYAGEDVSSSISPNTSLSQLTRPIQNETVSHLIEKLEALPRNNSFANEDRAHWWLLGKLQEWFPNRVVDEPNRKEADMSIDGKIAIEIKNFIEANPQQEIIRLSGQITNYAHHYETYVVVIFRGEENHKNQIMDMVNRCGVKNVEVVLI